MTLSAGASPLSWTDWTWDPAIIVGLAIAAVWYGWGVRALWRAAGPGRGIGRRQVGWFGAGLAVIALALLSPLDAMSDDLFAAHMVQHLLLLVAAPPLLVLGAPLAPLLWAVPRSSREGLSRWWHASSRLRRAVAVATAPVTALVTQSVAQWVWHAPAFYQAAITHPVLHAIEHACFLLTAIAFWWCVLQPVGRRRLSYGAAILFLWVALMQGGALGALLIFARSPWYPIYAPGVALWHTTLLADKQLAGLIMWIPAASVYIGAAAVVFLRWMSSEGSEVIPPRTTRTPDRSSIRRCASA